MFESANFPTSFIRVTDERLSLKHYAETQYFINRMFQYDLS